MASVRGLFVQAPKTLPSGPQRDLADLPQRCKQWGVMDEMRRGEDKRKREGSVGPGAQTAEGTTEGSQRERDDR